MPSSPAPVKHDAIRDTYTPSGAANHPFSFLSPTGKSAQIEQQIIRPVEKEAQQLELFLNRHPNLPGEVKQQYKQAVHKLYQFTKEVRDGKSPQNAGRFLKEAQGYLAYAQNLIETAKQEARGKEAEKLQAAAENLLGFCDQNFMNSLAETDRQRLAPDLAVLARYTPSPSNQAELRASVVRLKQNLTSILVEQREQFRQQILGNIHQLREQLAPLAAAEQKLGPQGIVATNPAITGFGGFFKISPLTQRGTTPADMLRNTKNPDTCRSVTDLMHSLNQLEGDINSGKPISKDRLQDLQRIANSPAIPRAQQNIAAGMAVEVTKTVAIGTAIATVGAVTGGLAAEAFAVYAGTGALATVGSLVIEGTVFTAVTTPLNYTAFGKDSLPFNTSDSGGTIAAKLALQAGENIVMFGVFKGVGRGLEILGATSPLVRLPVNFGVMNTLNLGSQILHGGKPGYVFSEENIGNTALHTLPAFAGIEIAGFVTRPIQAALREPFSQKIYGTDLRLSPSFRSALPFEPTGVFHPNPNGAGAQAFEEMPRFVLEQNNLAPKAVLPSQKGEPLKFGTPKEFGNFVAWLEGSENMIKVNGQRDTLQRLNNGSKVPIFEMDARYQVEKIWTKMSPAEQAAVKQRLRVDKVTSDLLIEKAGVLAMAEPDNKNIFELKSVRINLICAREWTEINAGRYNIRPEDVYRLTLNGINKVANEMSNLSEALPEEAAVELQQVTKDQTANQELQTKVNNPRKPSRLAPDSY